MSFDLVAADDDECNELSILHTGLYSDMNLAEHTFDNPKQVCKLLACAWSIPPKR